MQAPKEVDLLNWPRPVGRAPAEVTAAHRDLVLRPRLPILGLAEVCPGQGPPAPGLVQDGGGKRTGLGIGFGSSDSAS